MTKKMSSTKPCGRNSKIYNGAFRKCFSLFKEITCFQEQDFIKCVPLSEPYNNVHVFEQYLETKFKPAKFSPRKHLFHHIELTSGVSKAL